MYPLLRLGHLIATTRNDPEMKFGDTVERKMTCYPWDCDVFFEMNNGRVFTLYDLGRFDYGARIGLMKVLKKQGWGLVVGGSTIRYRKRIGPMQRFTMTTKLITRDERWFYFLQGMWRGEECCSSALMRTAVTEKGRIVETSRVAEIFDAHDWKPEPPEWVARWIEADAQRDWPPLR